MTREEKLGPYPHHSLNPIVKDKKQGIRLIKAECPGCGYIIRTTRKWFEGVGLPICGPCKKSFELAV